MRPTHTMRVSVNGGVLEPIVVPVTMYVPASGYNSGDYDTVIEGVELHYAVGQYRARFKGREIKALGPRAFTNNTVDFDFSDLGGPVLKIAHSL